MIFICAFSVSVVSAQDSQTYTNYQNHYTIEIPQGWLPIPMQEIEELERQANQTSDSSDVSRINYITGYRDYKNDSGHLMIQEVSTTGSLDDFEEQANSGIDLEDKYNIKVISQEIDLEFNRYYQELETNYDGIRIRNYSFIYPGRSTTTFIHYYSNQEDYEENLSRILSSANSFKYETGYEYRGRELATGSIDSGIGGGIAGMSFYVVGAVILGILGLLKRKKGKISKSDNKN